MNQLSKYIFFILTVLFNIYSCTVIDNSKQKYCGNYHGYLELDSSKINLDRLSPAEKMSYAMFSVMLQNMFINLKLDKDSIHFDIQLVGNPIHSTYRYEISGNKIEILQANKNKDIPINLFFSKKDTIFAQMQENEFAPVKLYFVRQNQIKQLI